MTLQCLHAARLLRNQIDNNIGSMRRELPERPKYQFEVDAAAIVHIRLPESGPRVQLVKASELGVCISLSLLRLVVIIRHPFKRASAFASIRVLFLYCGLRSNTKTKAQTNNKGRKRTQHFHVTLAASSVQAPLSHLSKGSIS